MEALLTTLGFLLITMISVMFHLRGQRPGPSAAAPPSGPPCPRCQAPIPAGSGFCPGCGVPLQVYEVVTARISAAPTPEVAGSPRQALHAMVRADRCVGCGTCVAACPEPGAIKMVGKVAVVDTVLCKAHGDCVKACPVGGISLSAGAAVQEMEVPEVNSSFESNIPGLYIVGELGGRGLIKNAINEGKIAVEEAVQVLKRQRAPVSHTPDGRAVLDLIIVGSGPAGLSAGLEAHKHHLNFAILEQGSLADSIRRYPRHKILLGEPVKVPLYGDLWVADASKETLLQVWETIIASNNLPVLTEHRVESVQFLDDIFHVQTSRGEYLARGVVLAMGRRGTPRQLEVPGEGLGKVFYDVIEMEAFAGSRVLVVGGGDSAIESAIGLANQPNTTVHLSYRGSDLTRVKERNRLKFEAAVAAGKLSVVFGSQVREIREADVVLAVGEQTIHLPNDYVIIRVGGDPPLKFLERIGVRVVRKDVPLMSA